MNILIIGICFLIVVLQIKLKRIGLKGNWGKK